MFCDFLSAFRVLKLIKSEASLKQTPYPKCKISIFIFARNIPPSTSGHYYLQWAKASVRGQVIFLVFHRPVAEEKYRVYVKPFKSFMHCRAKLLSLLSSTLHLLSPFPPYTLTHLLKIVLCSCKADQLCYKSCHLISVVSVIKEG